MHRRLEKNALSSYDTTQLRRAYVYSGRFSLDIIQFSEIIHYF